MTGQAAYHQLGTFIVNFQHAEAAIDKILVILAKADSEAVRILVNELEYSQRLKTADVLLARFVDLQRKPDLPAKAAFHKLMVELGKLGERRNDRVHSKYMSWINVETDRKSNGLSGSMANAECSRQSPISGRHASEFSARPAA